MGQSLAKAAVASSSNAGPQDEISQVKQIVCSVIIRILIADALGPQL